MYYSQDLNYDKIRRALTNQLESLKEQIRLNGEIQKKEVERLCEDYEIRLASIRRENSIRALFRNSRNRRNHSQF